MNSFSIWAIVIVVLHLLGIFSQRLMQSWKHVPHRIPLPEYFFSLYSLTSPYRSTGYLDAINLKEKIVTALSVSVMMLELGINTDVQEAKDY